jgi:hypothetical protein
MKLAAFVFQSKAKPVGDCTKWEAKDARIERSEPGENALIETVHSKAVPV